MVWWWVIGGVVAAASDIVASNSSGSSGDSTTSGPSRETLKLEEARKIEAEFAIQCNKFLCAHEQLALVHGQTAKKIYQDACAALPRDKVVAEIFSDIEDATILDKMHYKIFQNLTINHLCNAKTIHHHNVSNSLDLLRGLYVWDPIPDAPSSASCLIANIATMVLDIRNTSANDSNRPDLKHRFVVKISQNLPLLYLKYHKIKSLLNAVEHIELSEKSADITEYAAKNPLFAERFEQWRVLDDTQDALHPRVVVW